MGRISWAWMAVVLAGGLLPGNRLHGEQPERPTEWEVVDEVDLASLLQPAPDAPRTPAAPDTRVAQRAPIARLARVPNMFGDLHTGGGNIDYGSYSIVTQYWPGFVGDSALFFQGLFPPGVVVVPQDQIIAHQIGPGSDRSGDGIDDTFPISDPTNHPLTSSEKPVPPPGGVVIYHSGYAVHENFSNPQLESIEDPIGPNLPPAADGNDPNNYSLFFGHFVFDGRVDLVLSGAGASLGIMKLAENSSPRPVDRVFFNYNFYNDVLALGDVNRYTPGFEKTFFNGQTSIDVRFPFLGQLDRITLFETGDVADTRFGDITATFKAILLQGRTGLISGGFAVSAPTADDIHLTLLDGTDVLRVHHRSVHVMPFVALLMAPSNRCFWQLFVQADFVTNGDPVWADPTGQNLRPIGRYQDANLLFADFNFGYWMYQSPFRRGLTGIAPMLELHYTGTLNDTDLVAGSGLGVRSYTRRFDYLNLTAAVNFMFNDCLSVRPGFVIPLRDGDDQPFDYEAAVQANLYF